MFNKRMYSSMMGVWLLLVCVQGLYAQEFAGLAGLVERRVPWLKGHVLFEHVAGAGYGKDVFVLQSRAGKLVIGASGANAAAMGLNWYLKYYCHRSMSHVGDNLSVVQQLPVVVAPVKVESDMRYRYALNYCTYNYTMSFYGWEDWSHELDWMALNGVNLMLVANGMEAVWQEVLRGQGYSDKEIGGFLTGPAYNAWWLMGNMEGWGGPMGQPEIDRRRDLVRKMLVRMHGLGIAPVFPGFYGMVPSDFGVKRGVKVVDQGRWQAFIRPAILLPSAPCFDSVAGAFYAAVKRIYGADIPFFSGDPFHEGGSTKGVDLPQAGAVIQGAMLRAFPDAVWVLQGWQDNPKKALLQNVDRSHVLVQELFGENTNNWETRGAYEGTPFIWCCVNNFGERPGLNGKLQRYADEVYRAKTGALHSFMQGVGVMPEGIDNNPVSYELVPELAWQREHVAVDTWIVDYVWARYGRKDQLLLDAWKLLLQTVYSNPGYQEGPPEDVLCARPGLALTSVSSWGSVKKEYDTALFRKAVGLFYAAYPVCKGSETYRLDLISLGVQLLANSADGVYAELVGAFKDKDVVRLDSVGARFLGLHTLMDGLLHCDGFYGLQAYVARAMRAGDGAKEVEGQLRNALMLVTYWGGNDRKEDALHEYAYKEWGGMMGDFYKVRWEMYLSYLHSQLVGKVVEAPDYFAWERDWVVRTVQGWMSGGGGGVVKTEGDLGKEMRRVLAY